MPLTNDDMRRILRAVRDEVLGGFMTQTRISHPDESSDPCADTVTLDPEGDIHEPVARLEGWGDISVPEKDGETVLLHNGFQGYQIPLSGPRWRPGGEASKRGNRGLYSSGENRLILHGSGSGTPGQVEVVTKSGASIVIDKDGAPTITGAPGQPIKINAGVAADVIVNGGTLNVARRTDAVQVTIPIGAIVTAGGNNTNLITATGTIVGAGAANFKG